MKTLEQIVKHGFYKADEESLCLAIFVLKFIDGTEKVIEELLEKSLTA